MVGRGSLEKWFWGAGSGLGRLAGSDGVVESVVEAARVTEALQANEALQMELTQQLIDGAYHHNMSHHQNMTLKHN